MEYIDAKTIETNGGPDNNYQQAEYVMNIYRGCNHGCIFLQLVFSFRFCLKLSPQNQLQQSLCCSL